MTTTDNYDNCWGTFNQVLAAGVDRMILFGPPGTGKTFSALHVNKTPGQESHRLTCTDDMTNMDVPAASCPARTASNTSKVQPSRLVVPVAASS